ncbi:hypothetical protein PICMEDRAFT_145542 [Pichia membranifaciens NRRL Y-2026]|uniref:Uncharacterized protein n=1 Tax=Pichia membranifaciens NRRL Y-2026 TaxID=763406 RepID=A0A1E3NKE3_9ASCO|nr:hypothetical protein PICMEDRAFT_145542 [Pichia membranifaciens NRRL Y-2026]ODQ45803.1 hypothetical protein PICMEDRAFT_145542 [Pichia membranifaciens NRRL Y-2026]
MLSRTKQSNRAYCTLHYSFIYGFSSACPCWGKIPLLQVQLSVRRAASKHLLGRPPSLPLPLSLWLQTQSSSNGSSQLPTICPSIDTVIVIVSIHRLPSPTPTSPPSSTT